MIICVKKKRVDTKKKNHSMLETDFKASLDTTCGKDTVESQGSCITSNPSCSKTSKMSFFFFFSEFARLDDNCVFKRI